MTIAIGLDDARRAAIRAQRLSGPVARGGRAGLMAVIRQVGYVQLDPTNVVARNPLLVLWSRVGSYDTSILEDLLFVRRELFETPSLIVPTSDLPIHSATMRAYRRSSDPGGADAKYAPGDNTGGGTWARRVRGWLTQNRHVRGEVLARLRREGPLPLSAFEDRSIVSWTSGGWNDERNVTMLLAVLQRRGEVVVAGRRRGQKLYGLAQGWLPRTAAASARSVGREATLRALRALGVATLKQLRWQYAFGRHVTQSTLDALERSGEVVRVSIEGVGSKAPFYALVDLPLRLRDIERDPAERTVLLSPFDNLIIDRDRTEQLFGFHYRMEIYVPPQLRVRGYWAMPILHRGRIVGTVDPRFDREGGELVVNRVHLEPGVRGVSRAVRSITEELAAFLGAKRVRWDDRPG